MFKYSDSNEETPESNQKIITMKSAPLINTLGFNITRPDKITKEEVKFYREQTVCLVCKSSLIGFSYNFICPECKALYCENCAHALSDLENVCWSCDSKIDKSKPIRLEKDLEEVIVTDKELHKKAL